MTTVPPLVVQVAEARALEAVNRGAARVRAQRETFRKERFMMISFGRDTAHARERDARIEVSTTAVAAIESCAGLQHLPCPALRAASERITRSTPTEQTHARHIVRRMRVAPPGPSSDSGGRVSSGARLAGERARRRAGGGESAAPRVCRFATLWRGATRIVRLFSLFSRRPAPGAALALRGATMAQTTSLAVAARSCRRCGERQVGRSHRRLWEHPLSWLGVLPYRCLCCLARFLRVAWIRLTPADGAHRHTL